MTIQKNIELYKNGVARGAQLPRVLRHLGLSDADLDMVLAAVWFDMKYDILRGDFMRLDPANATEFDFGKQPDEVTALLIELHNKE